MNTPNFIDDPNKNSASLLLLLGTPRADKQKKEANFEYLTTIKTKDGNPNAEFDQTPERRLREKDINIISTS